MSFCHGGVRVPRSPRIPLRRTCDATYPRSAESARRRAGHTRRGRRPVARAPADNLRPARYDGGQRDGTRLREPRHRPAIRLARRSAARKRGGHRHRQTLLVVRATPDARARARRGTRCRRGHRPRGGRERIASRRFACALRIRRCRFRRAWRRTMVGVAGRRAAPRNVAARRRTRQTPRRASAARRGRRPLATMAE